MSCRRISRAMELSRIEVTVEYERSETSFFLPPFCMSRNIRLGLEFIHSLIVFILRTRHAHKCVVVLVVENYVQFVALTPEYRASHVKIALRMSSQNQRRSLKS